MKPIFEIMEKWGTLRGTVEQPFFSDREFVKEIEAHYGKSRRTMGTEKWFSKWWGRLTCHHEWNYCDSVRWCYKCHWQPGYKGDNDE